ncbi:MAG: NnrS family protein [Hyphomicrobiaceae bacterium]
MATSAAQIRSYKGPALLSYGFRPFFLLGAAWAALALPVFLLELEGYFALPSTLSPVAWHAHEMVFGYAPAIAAGFLLTAVPNWTGRLPIIGRPLALLVLAWLAGRVAMAVSLWIGPVQAGAIDLMFLGTLLLVTAREVIAAGNTRNLKVLLVLAALLVANAVSHVEAYAGASSSYGRSLGIAATIMLISLIGGRIVPSFTRNWLTKNAPGRLPAQFSHFDMAVLVITATSLAAWTAAPQARVTALLAVFAATANVWRLWQWVGWRAAREPLVLILHVAFAFVPVGFALVALAGLMPQTISMAGALHGWTAGAIALMTLAVMTRASLGHTGQPLVATKQITSIYLAVLLAAVARIAVAFGLWREPLLLISALSWTGGFLGFVIVFAPLLSKRRA